MNTSTDPGAKPAVVVANLTAPEINRLGVELARRGTLQRYVRPYTNKRRWWERTVERVPGVGHLYAQTLGRRLPPPGLPLEKVIEAGVTQDISAAIIGRLPGVSHAWRVSAGHKLLFAMWHAVAVKAGKVAVDADIVVASYGTGRYAFEQVRRSGGRSILSYPIAHNRYQQQFYREEAEFAPAFAQALPKLDELPPIYSEGLEVECELADHILVGSSFARESFIQMGYDGRKITVVPFGVDGDRFVPGTMRRDDGIFRVLFVGQIGQRKGVSYLLQGYKLFQRGDSELHVVGQYVAGREVYASYADLYRHTAHVPQHELPTLFQAADVFVFPSLIEGMGLVVLEAMACGVPVITTTRGPGDIVRDGIDGFFVPIRDPESIAMRLEQLYRDVELRKEMGRNAREQALRYSWDTYAQRAAGTALGAA